MSWTLFAWLFNQIDGPTVDFVNEAVAALSAHVAPIMRWGIIAYAAGQMLIFAYSPQGEPLTGFLRILIRCAIAYWIIASAANYNEYFGTVLRQTLPTEIGNVVAGTTGAPPVEGATFDGIWNKAWAAGLAVYRNLPWTIKAIGLTICIAIYWFVSIVCIGISFVVYLGADLILALLIAVGILFVALLPFPATRPYFDRWISACLSMVLLKIFIVTLLALLIRAENLTLEAIATTGVGAGWDSGTEIAQLQLLFGSVLLFFICGAVAKQLPSVAIAVTGGVVADAQALGTVATAAAGRVGGMASRAYAATVAAREPAVTSRTTVATPTGRSLSGD